MYHNSQNAKKFVKDTAGLFLIYKDPMISVFDESYYEIKQTYPTTDIEIVHINKKATIYHDMLHSFSKKSKQIIKANINYLTDHTVIYLNITSLEESVNCINDFIECLILYGIHKSALFNKKQVKVHNESKNSRLSLYNTLTQMGFSISQKESSEDNNVYQKTI